MKDWQHGIELSQLKHIESTYADYNAYALSPFAKYKKNDIAKDIHNDNLFISHFGSFILNTVKKRTPITMYGNVVIGNKMPGDLVVTKLRGSSEYIISTLQSDRYGFRHKNVWLYVWAEDSNMRYIMQEHAKNYHFVGSKITTFGEIYHIYFQNSDIPIDNAFVWRIHPEIDPTNFVTMKKLDVGFDVGFEPYMIYNIRHTLDSLDLKFQNHYSNYNKGKSWSALSLRGYSPDITRIEKPIEMNDAWKAKHSDEVHELQDTELMKEFSSVPDLIKSVFDNAEIHRVRLMKLAPGGGELTRHTDQVDPESGGAIGNLARYHFPIITNKDVRFCAWEPNGNKLDVNMDTLECWFLDTRKPHTVINGGNHERIHLVVDVRVDEKQRDMLLA